MAIHPPTTCPILRLLLRDIHRRLRGVTAMERVPHTTLRLTPDHHRAILATPKVTPLAIPKAIPKTIPKATPTNRSINSSTVGSLSLLMGMGVQVMMPQLSRSMLRTKATATAMDTSINHQTGIHSMTAIKRKISSLAWQLAIFQKLSGIDARVRRCIRAFVQVMFMSRDVHCMPEKVEGLVK